ncbi:hypothetical protein AVEN_18438-1, partial [Araneus ventricosus]
MELDAIGLRNNNLVKSKFILVVKDKFTISEDQIKAILPDPIVEVDGRKEVFAFS